MQIYKWHSKRSNYGKPGARVTKWGLYRVAVCATDMRE